MKPFAIVLVLLAGCAHESRRPAPVDTVLAGQNIPDQVYAAFEKGKQIDLSGMPVAIVGSLGSVDSKPHINIDGEEWSVAITVRKVLLGSWSGQGSLYFGVSNPSKLPLQPNRDYYVVAANGRHGTILLAILPVAKEPNQAPEPTSISRPRPGARVAPAALVAHL
jgi:hypothetical protein